MTVWLHLLQLHGISVINFIIMNMLLGIFGCGIFGWRHFILDLLYICILFNVIFGWRYIFLYVRQNLLWSFLSLLIHSNKPRAKKTMHHQNPFSGAEGTLHAKHTFEPAPTPPRASSNWGFGAELLQAQLEPCQTGPK